MSLKMTLQSRPLLHTVNAICSLDEKLIDKFGTNLSISFSSKEQMAFTVSEHSNISFIGFPSLSIP